MEDSKIFDEKYATCLSNIKTIDAFKKAKQLGLKDQGHQSIVFDFFNRQIVFDGQDFIDITGDEVPIAVKVVLCNYLLNCPSNNHKASDRLVTFREFFNAGPLFFRFSENIGKIINTTFSGHLEKLKSRCQSLGGILLTSESHDLSFQFQALNRIFFFLNFNDADEFMPANAMFLFQDDVETFLDMESLTIICTYFTGLFIRDR